MSWDTWQWMGARRGAALLAALVLVQLAGVTPVRAQAGRDVTTASDESDVQRRARIRMELAASYYSQGQLTTALDQVKQALAAVPELAEAYNLRGLIYSALGDDRLAEESFKRAVQINPQDGDTLHNYGFFKCERKRYAEADDLFSRASQVSGYRSVSRTLLVQGICEARSGDMALAEKTLTRAYEVDAGNPAIGMNLADVLYRRGDYERARFYVRRINAQPEFKNAESLWLAARIERKLGNESGMRELGQQLRDRFPQSREAEALERGRFDD